MSISSIKPPGPAIPGISPGVLVSSGSLMFLSGHVPLRSDGSMAGPGLEAQLDCVLRNLRATLRAGGGDFANVVRLTIYVRDLQPDQLDVIRGVRDRYVNAALAPASALIGVAALFHPEVLVEVDAIAAIDAR